MVGLQGRVYHRGGQVRTAKGVPDRGFFADTVRTADALQDLGKGLR